MHEVKRATFGIFPFGRFCSSFFIESSLRLFLFLWHLRNCHYFYNIIIIIIISSLSVCCFPWKYTASYINVYRLCLLGFPYWGISVCMRIFFIVELGDATQKRYWHNSLELNSFWYDIFSSMLCRILVKGKGTRGRVREGVRYRQRMRMRSENACNNNNAQITEIGKNTTNVYANRHSKKGDDFFLLSIKSLEWKKIRTHILYVYNAWNTSVLLFV